MGLDNFWAISDFHLGHEYISKKDGKPWGVRFFERHQFKSIQEHDEYIWNHLFMWAKQHQDSEKTLWILGDFGDVNQLHRLDELRSWSNYNITLNFIFGNHDSTNDIDKFQMYFDNVYLYPQFISPRVVLSHYPLYPCPACQINLHGHLHSSKLDSKQHINVSINDIGYQPIGWKAVAKRLGQIDKPNYKFLREPWADKYIFTQDKEDAVYNKKTGKIDLPASIKVYKQHHPDIKF